MKENKERWFLSLITGRGTYQENQVRGRRRADRRVLPGEGLHHRAGRRARARSTSSDSDDENTRWVELRIPVVEGERYRVGNFDFAGNTVVKTDALQPLFELKEGDYYSQKKIRKGFQKAQEVYGSAGYFEFTGYPEPVPRERSCGRGCGSAKASGAAAGCASQAPRLAPIVDVTMRLQEGKQYFVNRITFVGNTTTRDNVIRRELRLYENNVSTRGAAVQHQAAQPARLLQGARRARQGRDGRQDARLRQQGRRRR